MIINYLAIIPARSGSKGLIDKNIKKINNKTLIEITALTASSSDKIDGIFFTSDSENYINIYKQLNLKKDVTGNYIRPMQKATDEASSNDYIIDCLNYLKMNNITVKNFVLLQVTSPLRQIYHINEAIEMYENSDGNSLVSVNETVNHPANSYFMNNDKYTPVLQIDKKTRRQDYDKCVCLNGAIYIKNVDEYNVTDKIITDNTIFFLMEKKMSIDIDDGDDFMLAELIYNTLQL